MYCHKKGICGSRHSNSTGCVAVGWGGGVEDLQGTWMCSRTDIGPQDYKVPDMAHENFGGP